MNRRDFIRLASASVLSSSYLGTSTLYGAHHKTKLDRFGGWTGKKFKATGFFRAEKDERWWLVTPDGNAFLSWGINHLHTDLWQQEYNRGVWQEKLGLEELSGPAFEVALRTWFMGVKEKLGFNTVGVHCDLRIVNTPSPEMAYMQPITFVDIPHWKREVSESNFVDIFSKEHERNCDGMAKRKVIPVKDDPYLLGYAMTDCPLFTEEDCRERPDTIGGARRASRIGWPRRLRNLGGDAAGKKAYVQTMQEIYEGNISKFNTTYETSFSSWDALLTAKNWRPHSRLWNANESRDNVVFLQRCVGKYYETARNAIRRYDTNHMGRSGNRVFFNFD